MSLATVMNRLLGRRKAKQIERLQTYHELVESMAAGTEPTDDEIDAILSETGRTDEEFETDVELSKQRNAWQLEAELIDSATSRSQECGAEIERAEEAYKKSLDAAWVARRDAIAKAQTEFDAAQAAVMRGRTAVVRLRETDHRFAQISSLSSKNAERLHQKISLEIDRKAWGRHSSIAHDAINNSGEVGRIQSEIDRDNAEISRLEAEMSAKV